MRFAATARRLALQGILAAALPGVVAGQTSPEPARPEPYSRLRIHVSGARSVDHEPVDGYYRAGTGGAFAITTPFYVGSIGVAATYLPYRGLSAAQPNLRTLLLAVDWGADLPAPGPLRAHASLQIGDFVMFIHNPDTRLDTESELLTGGELSAGLALRRDLALRVAGSLARVHTRPALNLAIATIGVEYTTRTPGWLRAFLE